MAPRTLTVWLLNGLGRRRALISRVAGTRTLIRRSCSAGPSTPPAVASGSTDALPRAARLTSCFQGAAWRSSSTDAFGTTALCMAARGSGPAPTPSSGRKDAPKCRARSPVDGVCRSLRLGRRTRVGVSSSGRSGCHRSTGAGLMNRLGHPPVITAVRRRRRPTVSPGHQPLRSVDRPKLDFEHQLELSSRA